MDKVLHGNIHIATKLLRAKLITMEDLLRASLEQAHKVKYLNAFIHLQGKTDLLESIKDQKDSKKQMHGIPIAIKDNFCTKGIRTTCASKMLEGFTAPYNATVFERLQEAGAVLLGKTNMDQFAMGSGTVDSIFGSTKNPYNYKSDEDHHISGGSSGGSAVAVATGCCFAGIGSDTGGSTRNPASYCGVVGLKPTYGLVSRHGLIPLVNSMDVPGILARNVDDCVTVLNSVAGHDPKDSTTLTKPYRQIRLPDAGKISVKQLKVGIPIEYNCEHLSPEVLTVWNDVAKLLAEHGAAVKEVSLPHTEHSIVCYSILNQCEVASNMARYDGVEYGHRAAQNASQEQLYAETRRQGFNEVVRNRILAGNYFLVGGNYEKYFEKALRVRRLIADDFYNVWESVQVLLTPTTLTTAPKMGEFRRKTNRDQCALQDFCTQPANMAGIPALTIPIQLSSDGLPISLQIMGRSLSEAMVLALGKFIENLVQFKRLNEFSCITPPVN